MNVDVAEWSRDVSSGGENDKDESDDKRQDVTVAEISTFDSNELDSDDAQTEAGVCAGLELHLSGDGIARDVELVGEGDGEPDL